MKIWVVIPAHNEGYILGQILDFLKDKRLSLLVIDDGSKDNTYDIAKSYADIVLKNGANLGKGKTLQKAITYLLDKENFDYIITMDGDGQHAPSDIDKFIKEAQANQLFVIGNRMINPTGMPGLRIFTNKFMSWFISKIVKQNIPDTQCGFRLIRKDIFNGIQITTEKFEIETEIIVKAAFNGITIKSIPIKTIYSPNQKSRIHPIVDSLRFIRFIFSLFTMPKKNL